jgi:hypothetical protein
MSYDDVFLTVLGVPHGRAYPTGEHCEQGEIAPSTHIGRKSPTAQLEGSSARACVPRDPSWSCRSHVFVQLQACFVRCLFRSFCACSRFSGAAGPKGAPHIYMVYGLSYGPCTIRLTHHLRGCRGGSPGKQGRWGCGAVSSTPACSRRGGSEAPTRVASQRTIIQRRLCAGAVMEALQTSSFVHDTTRAAPAACADAIYIARRAGVGLEAAPGSPHNVSA